MSPHITHRIIHVASWGMTALLVPASALAVETTVIQSSYHDRCMTIGTPTEEGKTIKVAKCDKSPKAQWVFEPTLEGAYIIRSQSGETCLDVSVGEEQGYQIGDPVVQWGCHRESSQQWEIQPVTGEQESFKLKSRASGLCAEVLYTNEILQVDCHTSTHQVFRGSVGVGANIALDKPDYMPKERAQIHYEFGDNIGKNIGLNAWVGILPEAYDAESSRPVELALASASLKPGEGKGSVNLMAPKAAGNYIVQVFNDENGENAIGPAETLVVRGANLSAAPGSPATPVQQDGINFCGQTIPYNETVVSCNDAAVTDLTPLLELDTLKSLNLSGSGVTDLSMIQHLPSLEYLHINDTDVADLSPLAQHESLVFLNIAQTNVETIEVLSQLTDLSVVNIMGTALALDERKSKREIKLLTETKSGLEVII